MIHFNPLWFIPVFQGIAFGVCAMLLHEAGHLGVALCLGVRIRRVGLDWKGVYVVREAGPLWKNLLVSCAGPCINLLLSLFLYQYEGFGIANLCFGLVNLLPIEGSDGARILRYLKMTGEDASPQD